MAKWEHRPIIPYFNDAFDSGEENCLPYLPEEWTCNVPGRNEEIDILHFDDSGENLSGTLNLLKRPGLKIWKIDCFFSHPEKPEFANVRRSEKWLPSQWVEFFENAMYKRKVLEMTITGLNLVTYVTVENFEHTKRSGEELDTYYTIELKEYRFEEIKKEEINITQNWVGNDTTGYQGNVQNEKANIGNIAWIQGTAWRTITTNNDGSIELTNLITTKSGKYINFDMMKVNIIERKDVLRSSYRLTNYGNAISQYFKQIRYFDQWQIEALIEVIAKQMRLDPSGTGVANPVAEANALTEYIMRYMYEGKIMPTNYKLKDVVNTKGPVSRYIDKILYSLYDGSEGEYGLKKYRERIKGKYTKKEEIKMPIARVQFLDKYSEEDKISYDPNSNQFYDKEIYDPNNNTFEKKYGIEGQMAWVIDKEEGKEIHLSNRENIPFTQNIVEKTTYEQYYQTNK